MMGHRSAKVLIATAALLALVVSHTATAEEVRLFQVNLAKQNIGVPTINSAIAALRFFFNVTLERPELVRNLTTVHKPRRAPVVLNQEEMVRLIEAAPAVLQSPRDVGQVGLGLRAQ